MFHFREQSSSVDIPIVDKTVAVVVAPVTHLGLGVARSARPTLGTSAEPASRAGLTHPRTVWEAREARRVDIRIGCIDEPVTIVIDAVADLARG